MGFLHPAALTLSFLLGVLVLLYLRERHRRQTEVPSLLLWQRIPPAPIRPSRFRSDLLFLLQLLLLSALLVGRADPYFNRPSATAGARYVFILDTTASMQAREGRSTRFEEARAALQRRLGDLGPRDEAMLISAGRVPRVVAAFSRDRDALVRASFGLAPADTGGSLELALAAAHRALLGSGGSTRIEVFSDIPSSSIATNWGEAAVVWQFGETDDNVAVDGLQVLQGPFEDHLQARARVSVRNFSHRDAHGALTVSLDGRAIDRHGFSLSPRSSRVFSLQGFPAPGILRAALEIKDAFSPDDQAYAWIRPARTISLLAVGEPGPFLEDLERIAAAANGLRLRTVGPREYEGMTEPPADILLFDRYVPASPPAAASLFVFPQARDGWLASQGTASDIELLDWNDRHPILRGLRPDVPFPLRHVRLLERPPWSEDLLTARAGGRSIPLAFCGEVEGRRTVTLAFDPSADRLLQPDQLNLLLLFLNALDWLAPQSDSVAVVRTGEPQLLGNLPDETRHILDPRGESVTAAADGPLRIEPLWCGEYQVQADGTKRRLLANLFDSDESDIGRPGRQARAAPPVRRAGSEGGEVRSQEPRRGIGTWFYALAAALFVVEWLVAVRRG